MPTEDNNSGALVSEFASKGGKARAESLTPEQRKEIARQAAMARWGQDALQATHEGDFKIGDSVISAAVLPNGKRLLTQGTFLRAIGRSRSPKAGTGVLATVDGTPFFLQSEVLKPFLTEELLASTTPIFFRTKNGKKMVGYDAELLPEVAEIYLKYRDACGADDKPVPRKYAHLVRACDVVVRGLARVGIAALVDEATGYQEVRDRQALQEILDKYLRKEFAAWAKRFPDEFYKEIFRLRGWQWKGMRVNRPQCVAQFTRDLVYARLAPGILKELEERNPKDERGLRRARHHQWLTEDIGHSALAQHLSNLIVIMRGFDKWEELKKFLSKALPVKTSMPLFDDIPDE
jgi:P63C domain